MHEPAHRHGTFSFHDNVRTHNHRACCPLSALLKYARSAKQPKMLESHATALAHTFLNRPRHSWDMMHCSPSSTHSASLNSFISSSSNVSNASAMRSSTRAAILDVKFDPRATCTDIQSFQGTSQTVQGSSASDSIHPICGFLTTHFSTPASGVPTLACTFLDTSITNLCDLHVTRDFDA